MSNILIIEDESDLRTTLVDALEQAGYTVDAVESSEDGLARCIQQKPGLIILDIMTPAMHGATFLERLTELEIDLNTLPIIVLTALDNQETKDKMLAFPIKEYLIKSETSIATLLERIAEHTANTAFHTQ
jgi:DNA-binding response OmpR family regulator